MKKQIKQVIEQSPWFKWLERRYGAELATRIITDSISYYCDRFPYTTSNQPISYASLRIFNGFRGLWKHFWGFKKEDLFAYTDSTPDELKATLGDFWRSPVVLTCEDAPESLLLGHSLQDLVLNTLRCPGGDAIRCVDLAAEGFMARIFLVEDLPSIEALTGHPARESFLTKEDW